MRRALILAALAAVPGLASAQAAGQWRGPEHIFDATCRYCHEAGLAPPLLGAHAPPQAVSFAVRHGPGGMPAFTPTQISDAELKTLADWLQRQPAAPKPKAGGQ